MTHGHTLCFYLWGLKKETCFLNLKIGEKHKGLVKMKVASYEWIHFQPPLKISDEFQQVEGPSLQQV